MPGKRWYLNNGPIKIGQFKPETHVLGSTAPGDFHIAG